MKNLNRFRASRALRPIRPAVWAVAVAVAIGAAAAAIAAGQGNAAPSVNPDQPAGPPQGKKFKRPKLTHGVLKVKGTNESDKIVLRLQAGNPGILELDVGDDGSADFSFERARIASISVQAQSGDDLVRIDESTDAFTDVIPTTIDGGDGADTIAGGKGNETLFGGEGNDSIDGNGGNDLGLLGAGDDVFVWDPGDGSDTVEGQDGTDTMLFNGANGAEQVTVSPNANRLTFFRNPGNIKMDTAGVEQVDFNALGGADLITVDDLTGTDVTDVNLDLAGTLGGVTGDGAVDHLVVNGTNGDDTISAAGDAAGIAVAGLSAKVAIRHQEPTDELVVSGLGGNDAISAADLAAQAITLTLDGGTGNDTIGGAKGVETAIGGDGDDSIDGNGGNDLGLLGAGRDVFVWDPGDGSDSVEGQDGTDTMVFNGANGAEQITLSPNGTRLTLFRNLGNINMDTAGVEQVDVNALGGADLVTVNDLTGTDVAAVNADLAAALGGAAGDGAADHVIVKGTNGADEIVLLGRAGIVSVTGLTAEVNVTHAEAASDTLTVDSLAGADTVDASGVAAGAIELEIDGGDDADALVGSAGGDFVDGGKGADTAFLGPGDDTFAWDPGEGSDVVEGQSDFDTMVFNDANIAEQVTLSPNGNRLKLFRDIGAVTMDSAGVEQVDVNALGGADLVTVDDLTGTDVTDVNLDLAGTLGGVTGDTADDRVVVKATDGDDKIEVNGDAAGVKVSGLAAAIAITHAEAADRLEFDTLAGQDTVDRTGLAAGTLELFVNGMLVP